MKCPLDSLCLNPLKYVHSKNYTGNKIENELNANKGGPCNDFNPVLFTSKYFVHSKRFLYPLSSVSDKPTIVSVEMYLRSLGSINPVEMVRAG